MTYQRRSSAPTNSMPPTQAGRRRFLQTAFASTLMSSVYGIAPVWRSAQAAAIPVTQPIYANIMLPGGPDFRHILPPAYQDAPNSYGHQFWRNRAGAYAISNSTGALRNHWQNEFDARNSGGATFGISKQCGWLRQMWDAGHVAIINNVIGAQSRDHEHCQLVMGQGNRTSQPNDFERSGWGGRLASAASGACVSLTKSPRHFCYGAHPSGDINLYDNSNLVSAPDMRNMSLFDADMSKDQRWDTQGQIARTLRSYYSSLAQTLPANSPYRVYVEHERELREFGGIIDARLNQFTEPYALRRLHERVNGQARTLSNGNFGKQLSNLHDALLCHDILNLRVASLEYGGFDSHDGQKAMIEPRFNELFGTNKGLHTLWDNLSDDSRNNLVFGIMGEFGRQLKANGGNGTDHGRGNCLLLIGKQVKGGVYGDMFPEQELERLQELSPDIRGLTDVDRPFGVISNWVKPGSQWSVFPTLGASQLEAGVDLSGVLS